MAENQSLEEDIAEIMERFRTLLNSSCLADLLRLEDMVKVSKDAGFRFPPSFYGAISENYKAHGERFLESNDRRCLDFFAKEIGMLKSKFEEEKRIYENAVEEEKDNSVKSILGTLAYAVGKCMLRTYDISRHKLAGVSASDKAQYIFNFGRQALAAWQLIEKYNEKIYAAEEIPQFIFDILIPHTNLLIEVSKENGNAVDAINVCYFKIDALDKLRQYNKWVGDVIDDEVKSTYESILEAAALIMTINLEGIQLPAYVTTEMLERYREWEKIKHEAVDAAIEGIESLEQKSKHPEYGNSGGKSSKVYKN